MRICIAGRNHGADLAGNLVEIDGDAFVPEK
jgi:hypothetical protein